MIRTLNQGLIVIKIRIWLKIFRVWNLSNQEFINENIILQS